MKSHLGFLFLLALSANNVGAQPAVPDAPPLELLSEIRLLRLAIEKQTLALTRSHILVARHSSQEQRLTRARAQQDSVESRISEARADEDQVRTAIERIEAALDDPARAAQHRDIEGELRSMQGRLKAIERSLSELQARRGIAEQNTENERLRLDEIERALLKELSQSSNQESRSK